MRINRKTYKGNTSFELGVYKIFIRTLEFPWFENGEQALGFITASKGLPVVPQGTPRETLHYIIG